MLPSRPFPFAIANSEFQWLMPLGAGVLIWSRQHSHQETENPVSALPTPAV